MPSTAVFSPPRDSATQQQLQLQRRAQLAEFRARRRASSTHHKHTIAITPASAATIPTATPTTAANAAGLKQGEGVAVVDTQPASPRRPRPHGPLYERLAAASTAASRAKQREQTVGGRRVQRRSGRKVPLNRASEPATPTPSKNSAVEETQEVHEHGVVQVTTTIDAVDGIPAPSQPSQIDHVPNQEDGTHPSPNTATSDDSIIQTRAQNILRKKEQEWVEEIKRQGKIIRWQVSKEYAVQSSKILQRLFAQMTSQATEREEGYQDYIEQLQREAKDRERCIQDLELALKDAMSRNAQLKSLLEADSRENFRPNWVFKKAGRSRASS